jgi:hypothetical protein
VGNEGERLAFARLPTGVRVVGSERGYASPSSGRGGGAALDFSACRRLSSSAPATCFPEAAGEIVAGSLSL